MGEFDPGPRKRAGCRLGRRSCRAQATHLKKASARLLPESFHRSAKFSPGFTGLGMAQRVRHRTRRSRISTGEQYHMTVWIEHSSFRGAVVRITERYARCHSRPVSFRKLFGFGAAAPQHQ